MVGLASVLGLALGLRVCVAAALPPEDVPPARPASLELTWNAPPDCGSAEDVHARISALLTEHPNGDGEAKVVADIEVETGGAQMTLTTTFAGSTDVRELSSASCEALVEATALLLAVSLEPGLESNPDPALISTPEPERADRQESELRTVRSREALLPPVLPQVAETSPEVVAKAGPDSARTRARARKLWLYGLAAAGVERGAVQDMTGALRLGLGASGAAWAAEVLGTYLLPRRHPEGLFQVGLVGVRGCGTPGAEVWRVLLCGGAEFGGLRVDSRGLDPRRTGLGPYLGPVASVGALRRRGRVGVVVRAEAMVRAFGSQTVDESEVVLTKQNVVSLRFTLGVQFDLVGSRR